MENITNTLSTCVDIIVKDNIVKLTGLSNINESLSTHYLIYRITNNINGKYYIGQHKTDDPYDEYMGSGKLILKAESKHGLSNFTKEILFDFDNFDDMNDKEKELVPLLSCKDNNPMSYNLAEGGYTGLMSQSIKDIQSQKAKLRFDKMSPAELSTYLLPMREGLSNWLSSVSDEEYSQIKKNAGIKISKIQREKFDNMTAEEYDECRQRLSACGFLDTAGEKNPMYGKHLSDYMEISAYNAMLEKVAVKNRARSKDPKWLQKMHDVSVGENNPMFGHSCTEFMTEDEIVRWCKNIRKNAKKGKDNHMHGHSIEDFMDPDDYQAMLIKRGNSLKGKNKGKKCMKLPSETKWIFVKPEDIQKYLDLGYEFYSQHKGKKFKKVSNKKSKF